MIEFISREYVFQKCPRLAHQLMGYQQAMFNPSEDLLVKGEEVFLGSDTETPTVLTKEQAVQLNKEHAAHCAKLRDNFDLTSIKPTLFKNIIAELDVSSFDEFIEKIGPCLTQLTSTLGWDKTFIISDARIPYIAQENTHEPVKSAVQHLLSLGMTHSSTDGIVLDRDKSSEIFTSIFWIVRCNASAPGICFTAANANIIGMFCKYGNIHFNCYSQSEHDLLEEALQASNFRPLPNGICRESFSASGPIDGRKISVK